MRRFKEGKISGLDGGNAIFLTSKYGVDVYFCRVGETFDHIWMVNGKRPDKVIGDGNLVYWRGNERRENYFITALFDPRTENDFERGEFDLDKIISRGIAFCLAKSENLESLISEVPTEVFDNFPGVLPFVIKYHDKFQQNKALKGLNSDKEIRKKEDEIGHQLWEELHEKDLSLRPSEKDEEAE